MKVVAVDRRRDRQTHLAEPVAHRLLRGLVGDRERDVVDAAGAPAGRAGGGRNQIDDRRRATLGRCQPADLVVDVGAIAQRVAQERRRRPELGERQRHAVQAPHGHFRRHGFGAPRRTPVGRRLDEGEGEAVGVGKPEARLAETLLALGRAPKRGEPRRPPIERAGRHRELRLGDLAGAAAARAHVLPREEGDERARAAKRIAVIEVIGARIVEVHRALDQSQAQSVAPEGQIAPGTRGHGGDVV